MKTKYENIIQKPNGRYEAMFRMRGELVYVGIFDDIEEANSKLLKKRAEVNDRQLKEIKMQEERQSQKDSYWKTEQLTGLHISMIVVHNFQQTTNHTLQDMLHDYEIRTGMGSTPNGFIRYVESLRLRYLVYTKLQFDEIQKGNEVLLSRKGSDMIVLKPSKMNNDEFDQFRGGLS